MTIGIKKQRAKPRWLVLVAVMGLLTVFAAGGVLAQFVDKTLWELDGDATNNTTYTKVAVLSSAVAASSGTTTIQLCQAPATFANGTKILIDAERMTLAAGDNASGGGCPSDLPAG